MSYCLVGNTVASYLGFCREDLCCALSGCRDMFDHPNRKAMEVILFFLFNKLNPQRAKVEFK